MSGYKTEFDPFDLKNEDGSADDAQKLLVIQQQEDFKWLMSDPRGRRIVWLQMSEAGVFHPVFNQDAMIMAFKEGRRAAGLQLIGQVHTLCPDLYTTMMKEQLK